MNYDTKFGIIRAEWLPWLRDVSQTHTIAIAAVTVLLTTRLFVFFYVKAYFCRVNKSGIGKFPAVLRCKSDGQFLVCGKYLDRLRGQIAEKVLLLIVLTGRAAAVGFCLSYIGYDEFWWLRLHRWELAGFSVMSILAWFNQQFVLTQVRQLCGITFFAIFTSTKVILLRWVFCIPLLRISNWDVGLQLRVFTQKVTNETYRVELLLGQNNPVILGTVFGQRDADLISNGFAAFERLRTQSIQIDGIKISNTTRLSSSEKRARAE